ncbi:aspartate/glutamate racemase family protein [Desulfovibrio mangrovi]|uniref:aspartate/glutamate racemase family protein n=1 Tax=Desulfovibrio mangrovi TaxID=2976983 RepID=UPI00224842F4|nr:aspartate/glutamate racemase family protein [Desulfovibrio mangrovi]UZP68037.1 aspartate/glutamate racemase family protein [Desulfovibrio mangrovi]
MKTIGILGGMSWESTLLYYKWLNEGVRERLGGLNSARIVMHSVNFHPVEEAMAAGDWETVASHLVDGAHSVRKGGADFLVIATNTMHKFAERLEAETGVPVLHIVDATAEYAKAMGMHTVGLLGTAFTMEQDFYKGRLEQKHGLKVLTPDTSDRSLVHKVIFKELCCGQVCTNSREEYIRIINGMEQQGAQAVILGCTEICILVDSGCSPLPLLDTTHLHVQAALNRALSEG